MTTNKTRKQTPKNAPKLDAAAKKEEEKVKKEVKVLRVTAALMNGATGVKTYVERLDAIFFLSPRTRKTTETVVDEDPKDVIANLNPFGARLDQLAEEVASCVTGWEDSEDDEKPLRDAGGTLIQYSDENLAIFLSEEDILYVLAKETRDVGMISETIELGN